MSIGGPALATNQRKEGGLVPPGPPFAPTSADNGLSVDPVSGRIVLGNDVIGAAGPAALLSSREISMGAFSVFLLDIPNNLTLELTPSGLVVTNAATGDVTTVVLDLLRIESNSGANSIDNFVGPNDANISVSADQAGGSNPPYISFFSGLGNAHAGVNGAAFTVGVGSFPPIDDKMLRLDQSADVYEIGDIDNVSGGTVLSVDGNSKALILQDLNTAAAFIQVDGDNGITGTFGPVITSITVRGGIVTAVS